MLSIPCIHDPKLKPEGLFQYWLSNKNSKKGHFSSPPFQKYPPYAPQWNFTSMSGISQALLMSSFQLFILNNLIWFVQHPFPPALSLCLTLAETNCKTTQQRFSSQLRLPDGGFELLKTYQESLLHIKSISSLDIPKALARHKEDC